MAEVLPVDAAHSGDYGWAEYHPHFQRLGDPHNMLYLASRRLRLDGRFDGPCEALPGAGVFPHFVPERQLTAPDTTRTSHWRLPAWCYPQGDRTPFTYHANRQRWQKHANHVELTAAARGQEFILDSKAYPEALPWACELIRSGMLAGQR